MKVIIKRTLQETLKPLTIIFVAVASFIGGSMLRFDDEIVRAPAFTAFLNERLMEQHLIMFFLINGLVLMALAASFSSGLIASEEHEGTLRILVTKPHSRIQILAAKIIGMWIGIMLLMIFGIFLTIGVEMILSNMDGNIMKGLLTYVPGYILYGIIVTLFFSSLGTLLSCVAKRKVLALIPLMVIMIVVLGIPIVARMISGSGSMGIFDMNYHFGSMYLWCLERCGPVTGDYGTMQIFMILTNALDVVYEDIDITHGNMVQTIVKNNTISVLLLLVAYVLISAANYAGSFLIIRKKNI